MAVQELTIYGELKYRNELKKNIFVKTENSLSSMIVGIKKFNEDVSELLTELVERGKLFESGDQEESDDEENDDSDEERQETATKPELSVSEPPAKRTKSLKMCL